LKHCTIRSKNHNQEFIDQIESSIKNRTIIPILAININAIYKYHKITSKFDLITFNLKIKDYPLMVAIEVLRAKQENPIEDDSSALFMVLRS